MKTVRKTIIICLFMATASIFAQSNKDEQIMADAQKAKLTMLAKDAGLGEIFANSAGYAIFPNVGKGGLIIGGASGNGILYENEAAVGRTSLKKINIGLQAGGQAFIQIIFFETDSALNKFKQANYEFSAEASAVIADEGIAETIGYSNGVMIITLPKAGIMADVSVGGQKFEYHAF